MEYVEGDQNSSLTSCPHFPSTEALEQLLKATKSRELRHTICTEELLEPLVKGLELIWRRWEEEGDQEDMLKLLRILRNMCCEGECVAHMYHKCGLASGLREVMLKLVPCGQSPTGDSLLLAVTSAQLLANWSTTGCEGAEAIWAGFFPDVILQLSQLPSVKVQGPLCEVILNALRWDSSRCKAMCSVEGVEFLRNCLEVVQGPNDRQHPGAGPVCNMLPSEGSQVVSPPPCGDTNPGLGRLIYQLCWGGGLLLLLLHLLGDGQSQLLDQEWAGLHSRIRDHIGRVNLGRPTRLGPMLNHLHCLHRPAVAVVFLLAHELELEGLTPPAAAPHHLSNTGQSSATTPGTCSEATSLPESLPFECFRDVLALTDQLARHLAAVALPGTGTAPAVVRGVCRVAHSGESAQGEDGVSGSDRTSIEAIGRWSNSEGVGDEGQRGSPMPVGTDHVDPHLHINRDTPISHTVDVSTSSGSPGSGLPPSQYSSSPARTATEGSHSSHPPGVGKEVGPGLSLAPQAVEDPYCGGALMEALLHVLAALFQRDDQGRGICGGQDVGRWFCASGGVQLLLGLLAALGPVENPKRETQPRDEVSLPAPLLERSLLYPRAPIYSTYRMDLVQVLSNALHRRPYLSSEVTTSGGLHLLLAQCQLDERCPVTRECALWGIRNLCEENEGAQKLIMELNMCGVVDSPELRQMGYRLEQDQWTGKMKMVKLSD